MDRIWLRRKGRARRKEEGKRRGADASSATGKKARHGRSADSTRTEETGREIGGAIRALLGNFKLFTCFLS